MTKVSSVRDEVSGDTVYNEVRMLRGASHKAILLVEGSSDSQVLKHFTSGADCIIVVCLGKDNLFAATTRLESDQVEGVLGFADRDFSDLLGYPEYHGTVVFTDQNDFETQILCSPAIGKILGEFGSSGKLKSAFGEAPGDPHKIIASWSAPIGALRLASTTGNWGLSFSEMKYQFKSNNSPEICSTKTSTHVLSRSSKATGHTIVQTVEIIEKNLTKYSPLMLANGHDCIAVLAKALRHRLGNTNEFNGQSGPETLEKILRLSYEIDMFRETSCYLHIRFWERATGFVVLNDTRLEIDALAA